MKKYGIKSRIAIDVILTRPHLVVVWTDRVSPAVKQELRLVLEESELVGPVTETTQKLEAELVQSGASVVNKIKNSLSRCARQLVEAESLNPGKSGQILDRDALEGFEEELKHMATAAMESNVPTTEIVSRIKRAVRDRLSSMPGSGSVIPGMFGTTALENLFNGTLFGDIKAELTEDNPAEDGHGNLDDAGDEEVPVPLSQASPHVLVQTAFELVCSLVPKGFKLTLSRE